MWCILQTGITGSNSRNHLIGHGDGSSWLSPWPNVGSTKTHSCQDYSSSDYLNRETCSRCWFNWSFQFRSPPILLYFLLLCWYMRNRAKHSRKVTPLKTEGIIAHSLGNLLKMSTRLGLWSLCMVQCALLLWLWTVVLSSHWNLFLGPYNLAAQSIAPPGVCSSLWVI